MADKTKVKVVMWENDWLKRISRNAISVSLKKPVCFVSIWTKNFSTHRIANNKLASVEISKLIWSGEAQTYRSTWLRSFDCIKYHLRRFYFDALVIGRLDGLLLPQKRIFRNVIKNALKLFINIIEREDLYSLQ